MKTFAAALLVLAFGIGANATVVCGGDLAITNGSLTVYAESTTAPEVRVGGDLRLDGAELFLNPVARAPGAAPAPLEIPATLLANQSTETTA